jgi:hypothetical protein
MEDLAPMCQLLHLIAEKNQFHWWTVLVVYVNPAFPHGLLYSVST